MQRRQAARRPSQHCTQEPDAAAPDHPKNELYRRYERARLEGMTYEEALKRFAALWAEARALGVDGRDDWFADLEPDLAVARALNGLPPSA